MRSWDALFHWAKRQYDLDAYRPHLAELNGFGQAPAFCHRCEQISPGMAWEPQTREGLCLLCYERSEYAHRKCPWV